MQALTRELRQFETVFIRPTCEPQRFERHIFDLTRERDFAGRPLPGAAAVLHDALRESDREPWLLRINGRDAPVSSRRHRPGAFHVSMDQGTPLFGATADAAQTERALAAFSLTLANLAPDLAPAVVSTGLRYLVVPIRSGLAEAKVAHPQLEQLLAELDAEFAYLLDVPTREGRHWENHGSLEDIAPGSAAGAVAAFPVRSDARRKRGAFGKPRQTVVGELLPDRGIRDELAHRGTNAGIVVEGSHSDPDRLGVFGVRAEQR